MYVCGIEKLVMTANLVNIEAVKISPAVTGCQDQVLPPWMLTDQQISIGCVCAPAHAAVDKASIFERW